jgi:cytochrome c553
MGFMEHCKICGFDPSALLLSAPKDMKSLLALTFAMVVAAPALAADAPAAAAPADPAKGQTIAAGVCVACHTFDGSRGLPANPILQGQHPEYLAKQLAEFKSGARPNAIMAGFAAGLSEQDMKNVSAFYASKPAPLGAATNQDLVLLGETIYRGGIAEKQVPACASCHGATGSGIPIQYPRVNGQHAEYTAAQLSAFRIGERKNNAQMTAISARLSDVEIKAVSDYIAGLR